MKIKKGWYLISGVHVLKTETMGADKREDWIAVKCKALALKIWHGMKVEYSDILWIGNRLKDYNPCDQE